MPARPDGLTATAACLAPAMGLGLTEAVILLELYRANGPLHAQILRRRTGVGSLNSLAASVSTLRTKLPWPLPRAGRDTGTYELSPALRMATRMALAKAAAEIETLLAATTVRDAAAGAHMPEVWELYASQLAPGEG